MANRKRYLVDPTVQWAIGRRVIVHWLLFLVCLASINAFLFVVVSLTDTPFWTAVGQGIRAQSPVLGVMLVLLPMFVRDTMKLSNRFTGPMFRLRDSITKLARGEATRPVKFREGDFWGDVADEFNGLRERVEFLEERNRTLSGELQAVRKELGEPAGV